MKNTETKNNIFNNMLNSTKEMGIELGLWMKGIALGLFNFIINFPKNTADFVIAIPEMAKNTYTGTIKWFVNKKEQTINIKTWNKEKWKSYFLQRAIIFSLLLIILYIIFTDNTFLRGVVFVNIFRQSSVRLIVALGVSTIIIAKGTDLSAGRMIGFMALITSLYSQQMAHAFAPEVAESHPFIIMMLAMSIGAAFGLVNGFIVAKLRVTPFVATLGTSIMIFGLNVWFSEQVSGAAPIGIHAPEYFDFMNKSFTLFGTDVPYLIVWALLIALIVHFIWKRTSFGKKLFAVGGNPEAADVTGINVSAMLMKAYMMGGILYGVAAVFQTWDVGSVTAGTAAGWELDAIAAAIVGGLTFDGGKGKVSGVIVGVVLFQTISVGLAYIGVSSAISNMVKGAIIIAAVSFDMLQTRGRKA